MISNFPVEKWYDTVQVQLDMKVLSSFVSIYIHPVITVTLIKVGLCVERGCEKGPHLGSMTII